MRARYRPRPKVGQEIPVSVLGVESRDMTMWIASEPLLAEGFPHCIRNILARAGPLPGRHRALATLAAFLGQAGWKDEEARMLWNDVASRSEVSEKVFDSWYRKLHCPKCDTIRKKSKGYPIWDWRASGTAILRSGAGSLQVPWRAPLARSLGPAGSSRPRA